MWMWTTFTQLIFNRRMSKDADVLQFSTSAHFCQHDLDGRETHKSLSLEFQPQVLEVCCDSREILSYFNLVCFP